LAYEILETGPVEVRVHLWCQCRIAPLKIDRWMSLRLGEAALHMEHAVTNVSVAEGEFEFLWGLHPGFAISPGMHIELPAESVTVDRAVRTSVRGCDYVWPHFVDVDGEAIDMRLSRGGGRYLAAALCPSQGRLAGANGHARKDWNRPGLPVGGLLLFVDMAGLRRMARALLRRDRGLERLSREAGGGSLIRPVLPPGAGTDPQGSNEAGCIRGP